MRLHTVKKLQLGIEDLKSELSAKLTTEETEQLRTVFEHAHSTAFELAKQQQRDKYDALLAKNNTPTTQGRSSHNPDYINTDKWVVNLSDRELAVSEKKIWKKWLNFCVTQTSRTL